jgi:hypothetical protein
VATICRCILGTLKYEPHSTDVTPLTRALESVIEHMAKPYEMQARQARFEHGEKP